MSSEHDESECLKCRMEFDLLRFAHAVHDATDTCCGPESEAAKWRAIRFAESLHSCLGDRAAATLAYWLLTQTNRSLLTESDPHGFSARLEDAMSSLGGAGEGQLAWGSEVTRG
jgi:hypothetical protein